MPSTTAARPLETLIPADYWASSRASVSLAPGVRIEGPGLAISARDHVVLNPVGQSLVECMRNEVTMGALTTRLQRSFDLSPDHARRDVRMFVDDLQARGLASVRQPAVREFAHRAGGPLRLVGAMWSGTFPQRHRYPQRRLPASSGQVVRACTRAMLPTAIVMICGAMVFGVAHLWRRGAGPDSAAPFIALFTAIAICVGGYLVATLLTLVAHELAHLAVARSLAVDVRSVFVRFSTAGVSHGATSPPRQALVAVAGGLSGFLVAAVLTVVLLVLPLQDLSTLDPLAVDVLVVFSGVVLMGLHLSSLTPVTGEGRRLWAAVANTMRRAA